MSWKETVKLSIDIIQTVAIVVGLYFTVQALEDTHKVESAKFILEINRDLRSDKFNKWL